MKLLILIGLVSVVSASRFCPPCPAACPTECQLKAARETIDAMFTSLHTLADNLDPIFCGCCEVATFATRRQETFTGELIDLSAVLLTTLGVSKSAHQAAPTDQKWIPFLPPCQPGTCSKRCAQETLSQVKNKIIEIDYLLAKRCLCSSEECEKRVETITAVVEAIAGDLERLSGFTSVCVDNVCN